MKIKTKTNPQKALKILRRLQKTGLSDRFRGMTEEAALKELKKTREQLWQEKLAARP